MSHSEGININYTIEHDKETKTVIVKVACLLSQEIRKEILLNISSYLRVSSYSKVVINLTDSTFNPSEPMTGALDLVRYMRTLGIDPDVRLAFIYSDSESHRKYFENVAQTDGFNIRYFKESDEAVAWLNS